MRVRVGGVTFTVKLLAEYRRNFQAAPDSGFGLLFKTELRT
jgi:hypothetical protein